MNLLIRSLKKCKIINYIILIHDIDKYYYINQYKMHVQVKKKVTNYQEN